MMVFFIALVLAAGWCFTLSEQLDAGGSLQNEPIETRGVSFTSEPDCDAACVRYHSLNPIKSVCEIAYCQQNTFKNFCLCDLENLAACESQDAIVSAINQYCPTEQVSAEDCQAACESFTSDYYVCQAPFCFQSDPNSICQPLKSPAFYSFKFLFQQDSVTPYFLSINSIDFLGDYAQRADPLNLYITNKANATPDVCVTRDTSKNNVFQDWFLFKVNDSKQVLINAHQYNRGLGIVLDNTGKAKPIFETFPVSSQGDADFSKLADVRYERVDATRGYLRLDGYYLIVQSYSDNRYDSGDVTYLLECSIGNPGSSNAYGWFYSGDPRRLDPTASTVINTQSPLFYWEQATPSYENGRLQLQALPNYRYMGLGFEWYEAEAFLNNSGGDDVLFWWVKGVQPEYPVAYTVQVSKRVESNDTETKDRRTMYIDPEKVFDFDQAVSSQVEKRGSAVKNLPTYRMTFLWDGSIALFIPVQNPNIAGATPTNFTIQAVKDISDLSSITPIWIPSWPSVPFLSLSQVESFRFVS